MAENVKRRANGYGYDSYFPTCLRALLDNKNGISPLGKATTQSELARHLGITRQAISAYTLGTSIPDIVKFKEIADFFHVRYDYLLGSSVLPNYDQNDFAETSRLSEKTLNAILQICRKPKYAFTFSLLVQTDEFKRIIELIANYLSISWTKNVSHDELLELNAKVKQATCGALRVVPATMEKELLLMNIQEYLKDAVKNIDRTTTPPTQGRNDRFFNGNPVLGQDADSLLETEKIFDMLSESVNALISEFSKEGEYTDDKKE